ncbi:MFS transporter [Truncatella angustata]|uniref:MFS transporter n=1 Tax=Truncatella angustata TaxID=152316 RepID=A0A9P8ZZ85_9PEZI|nr:MFS transporter [Truncatella angustata]KAH6655808.1 MFS transporter [Truncatella angustata]
MASTTSVPATQEKQPESNAATSHGRRDMTRWQAALIVTALTGISSLNTLGSGILTIALPAMAQDIDLDEALLLWPPSVYALAAGCSLLIFGAVSDVLGPRPMWLTGAALYSAFTLGVGLCNTAAQLITFRTLLGLSIAMCLPAAVSLTTQSFLPGRWRNMAFACQGMGQPLGYSLGLILGGVFTDTIGWRWGYYISLIINVILVICAYFVLPSRSHEGSRNTFARLGHDVDWVGAIIVSASLGLLSYVLSAISRDYHQISTSYNIALLVLGVLLLPAFVMWMEYREHKHLPALVPNSMWKNAVFSTTCVTVFVTWAIFNAFQYYGALYFERVVHTTALQASIRFLPMVFVGAATNIVTGYLVDKVEVGLMVSITAAINVVPPLLMALSTPDRGYWRGDFFAMLLSPLHPDVLFTVSNLIIAKAYPGKSQSLAGAVFNAVSQIGNSVGLAVTSAIASSVTQSRNNGDEGLMDGYHAAFWTMFAAMVLIVPGTYFGLRRGGRVGAAD